MGIFSDGLFPSASAIVGVLYVFPVLSVCQYDLFQQTNFWEKEGSSVEQSTTIAQRDGILKGSFPEVRNRR